MKCIIQNLSFHTFYIKFKILMLKGIQFVLINIFILEIVNCPDNCNTCTADPTICDSCVAGFQLNETTFICSLSYTKQSQWGGICNTGIRQSPINIDSYHENLCPSGAQFTQTTSLVSSTIKPEGQDLKTLFRDQSTVSYTRSSTTHTYNSLQFHWHHPSQHQVDAKKYDLQLHIVHSNTDGSGALAVTGLFFTVDHDMKTDILDKYNFFSDNSSHPFSFPIFLKNRLVYHYEGSLTIPPCTQNVNWFVYTQYFPITERNLELIKEQINENRSNARNAQNLNSRSSQIMGSFCNGW